MKPPTLDEQLSATINVALEDAAGNAAPPITVRYQVDCMTTGQSVVAPVVLATPGASFDIAIASDDNAIIDAANPQEYKRLTVEATYADGNRLTGQFDWVINNLSFIG